jgi:hypothetical protein
MRKTNGVPRFDLLAREVFTWDAAIRWIALDEPGCRPQLEWREPDTPLAAAAATPEALTIDPLVLMLAEDRHDIYGGGNCAASRDLRFVVLTYRDRAQIVTRFGQNGYINIGVNPAADAYRVGTRLAGLLDGSVKVLG